MSPLALGAATAGTIILYHLIWAKIMPWIFVKTGYFQEAK